MPTSPVPNTSISSMEDKADPEVQSDVDTLILDYLLCNAINAILRSRIAERRGQVHSWDVTGFMSLFSKFNSVFSMAHAQTRLPQDIAIKLQLLSFANRFFCRYTQSEAPFTLPTRVVRGSQKDTAGTPSAIDEHPAPPTGLDGNYHSMILQLKIPPLANTCTRKELIPLSDIVPDLIALCTLAVAKISGTRWLDLVARFMLQASLEAYLVFGSMSPELFDEHFAWIPMEPNWALEWAREGTKYMKYLKPQTGVSLNSHLENISKDFSIFQLEGMIIDFLVDLMAMLEPPVLIQLERGKLDGFSHAETLMLKDQVGL